MWCPMPFYYFSFSIRVTFFRLGTNSSVFCHSTEESFTIMCHWKVRSKFFFSIPSPRCKYSMRCCFFEWSNVSFHAVGHSNRRETLCLVKSFLAYITLCAYPNSFGGWPHLPLGDVGCVGYSALNICLSLRAFLPKSIFRAMCMCGREQSQRHTEIG